jgi:hypothetical protein
MKTFYTRLIGPTDLRELSLIELDTKRDEEFYWVWVNETMLEYHSPNSIEYKEKLRCIEYGERIIKIIDSILAKIK